jgi:hypothetical protein
MVAVNDQINGVFAAYIQDMFIQSPIGNKGMLNGVFCFFAKFVDKILSFFLHDFTQVFQHGAANWLYSSGSETSVIRLIRALTGRAIETALSNNC